MLEKSITVEADGNVNRHGYQRKHVAPSSFVYLQERAERLFIGKYTLLRVRVDIEEDRL
jgi:hypothetical protein